jgi:AraC family transcriptional regulator
MTTPVRTVPVTMGSPIFRTLEIDGFGVTEAWFPAKETLNRHIHDRACVAVMLDGSFDLHFTGRTYECPPATVFTEPAGESHANVMGHRGAHVVVVQPDPTRHQLLGPFTGLLERATHRLHAGIAGRAARLVQEFDATDGLGQFAAEGIVLEMLVDLVRLEQGETRRPPSWLLRAQELLHARFTDSIRTAEVASAVGVHPAHLARTFRAHFRLSVGSYVRRLRLDWAAQELRRSEISLAALALAAGFADQSHFTRYFKRHVGLTPNAYRRLKRH